AVFFPATEYNHTIFKRFSNFKCIVYTQPVIEICRLNRCACLPEIDFISERCAAIYLSSEFIKRMIFFVKLEFAVDGSQRIVANQPGPHFSIGAANGKQLVKIPDGKTNTIEVGKDRRSWFSEF